MKRINLGIVSQTPVIRLVGSQGAGTVKLADLKKNEYAYTVGGVAPLVKSQLEELEKEGFVRSSIWFSLNPGAPQSIMLSKSARVVSVSLEPDHSKNYTNFKEEVWKNIHNLKSRDFTAAEYLGYFRYNSRLAKIMLSDYTSIDLFEIHDFQQMLLGAMLGPTVPTILRWHGPFVPEILNSKIRKFLVNGLEGNDAVIVSTRRDLEGLIRAGYRGRAYQIYPHLDTSIWKQPGKNRMAAFIDKFRIRDDEFLILNVARMDPIKSQDDLIRAAALLKNRKIKLMFIGGGSFTSKALGHPKGEIWLRMLKRLVRRLGLESRVLFAGNLGHEELECAYKRANLFVLPSRVEGFGLVTIESWLYSTPAIISEGAGAAELVSEGFNGFTFRPADYRSLARKIQKIYDDRRLRSYLGGNADRMAKICNVTSAINQIKRAYSETIDKFGAT